MAESGWWRESMKGAAHRGAAPGLRLPALLPRLLAPVLIALGLAACSTPGGTAGGATTPYRLALVALVDDAGTRAAFEDTLAAKLIAANYDAVPSYGIVADPGDFKRADFIARLEAAGVDGIVMMQPVAVGPGASLAAVRSEVSEDVYRDMRGFARRISPGGDDELVAVVHTAFYMLKGDSADLLSSGAVWLDEPPASRADGVAKLQDLIVTNMNRARPAVRAYLGLPPL